LTHQRISLLDSASPSMSVCSHTTERFVVVIRSPPGSMEIDVTTGGVLRMETGPAVTHSDHISPSDTLARASQTSPFEVASEGTQFMSL